MVLLLGFALLAGAATAVSPCVLPVLPIALSAGMTGGRRRPLGIVTGLAIMVTYLALGGGIYGTIWILLLAYLTRFLPYGMRFNTASLVQVHGELEESAAVAGADWLTSFRRILLPLLKPGLMAGWIYIAIISVRELSSSVLLYSPDSEVLSVVLWEMWQNGQYVELSDKSVKSKAKLEPGYKLVFRYHGKDGIVEVTYERRLSAPGDEALS